MLGTSSAPGIIPRVIVDTFTIVETLRQQSTDTLYQIEMSYVELYNNSFKNLLLPIILKSEYNQQPISDLLGAISTSY